MFKLLFRIKEIVTVALIIIMFASLVLNGNVQGDGEETTTLPQEDSVVEETTQQPSYDDYTETSEYDCLIEEMYTELDKKQFVYEVNMLFKETFDYVYKYYSGWEKGYRDFPTRAEFIRSNLINVIKDISEIEYIEVGSEKADKMYEEGMTSAWVEVGENSELKIVIIAEKFGTEYKINRNHDIECFLHELGHCKAKNLYYNYDVYYNGYPDFVDIMDEGMATFTQKFASSAEEDFHGYWSISNSERKYNIEYKKNNCIGSLINMNACEKLVYLVGYKTVEKVEKAEQPFSIIPDAIAEKYGEQRASKFISTVKDWYVAYNGNWCSDETYNLAIELEKQFLDFIKTDIEALKTKKEAKAYKPVYDLYINRNLPEVVVNETYENISFDVFDIGELDMMLDAKLYK